LCPINLYFLSWQTFGTSTQKQLYLKWCAPAVGDVSRALVDCASIHHSSLLRSE
jgi:hypothetical protein